MKFTQYCCLFFFLLISTNSFGFYCGQFIIDQGDRKDRVLEKCGEPESTQSHKKIVGSHMQDRYNTFGFEQFEEVIVDEWIYNFGPTRFKQYLRFENGILREIRDLERGS